MTALGRGAGVDDVGDVGLQACLVEGAVRVGAEVPVDADQLGTTRQDLSNHLACLRGCGLVLAVDPAACPDAHDQFGWSWADPLAALAIAAVAVHEGREAWNGDSCCTPNTAQNSIPGGEASARDCADGCCDPTLADPTLADPTLADAPT